MHIRTYIIRHVKDQRTYIIRHVKDQRTYIIRHVKDQLYTFLIVLFFFRYYSTSIFCKIGVASYISTFVVGALNFFTTILSIVLVDKVCIAFSYNRS